MEHNIERIKKTEIYATISAPTTRQVVELFIVELICKHEISQLKVYGTRRAIYRLYDFVQPTGGPEIWFYNVKIIPVIDHYLQDNEFLYGQGIYIKSDFKYIFYDMNDNPIGLIEHE